MRKEAESIIKFLVRYSVRVQFEGQEKAKKKMKIDEIKEDRSLIEDFVKEKRKSIFAPLKNKIKPHLITEGDLDTEKIRMMKKLAKIFKVIGYEEDFYEFLSLNEIKKKTIDEQKKVYLNKDPQRMNTEEYKEMKIRKETFDMERRFKRTEKNVRYRSIKRKRDSEILREITAVELRKSYKIAKKKKKRKKKSGVKSLVFKNRVNPIEAFVKVKEIHDKDTFFKLKGEKTFIVLRDEMNKKFSKFQKKMTRIKPGFELSRRRRKVKKIPKRKKVKSLARIPQMYLLNNFDQIIQENFSAKTNREKKGKLKRTQSFVRIGDIEQDFLENTYEKKKKLKLELNLEEKRLNKKLKEARNLTNPFFVKDKVYEKCLKEINQKKNLRSIHKVKGVEDRMEYDKMLKKAEKFGGSLKEKMIKKLEKERVPFIKTGLIKKALKKRKFVVHKSLIS